MLSILYSLYSTFLQYLSTLLTCMQRECLINTKVGIVFGFGISVKFCFFGTHIELFEEKVFSLIFEKYSFLLLFHQTVPPGAIKLFVVELYKY